MYQIEVPIGDYTYEQFARYCGRFNCRVHGTKRGDVYFKVETDDYTNFFWLGANLNFKYETGIAISSASELSKVKKNHIL